MPVMKKVILSFAAAAIALACSDPVCDVEVIPIQDNANPRLMPRALFVEAPDDLFEKLGLQDGIPSSVCAFLVKTEGKNIYINKVEYDAWMAMSEEQNKSLTTISQAYADRLKVFSLDDTLPCGVKAIAAYGHTPGHTVYRVGDALIVGDIMHGVALQLEYPQYCARFDADHEQSIKVRKEILQMGKDNGLTLYGMHFPAPYFIHLTARH